MNGYDMEKFEVAFHNEEVRRLLKEGEQHKHLSDDWGDTHYLEVRAPDKLAAAQKVLQKYPETQGYVIETVTPALD